MTWITIALFVVAFLAASAWLTYFSRIVRRLVRAVEASRGAPDLPARTEVLAQTEAKDTVAPVESSSSKAAPVPRRIIHDLNNLVGTITGFTDAALEDLPRSNPVREDLEEILEAALRVAVVIEQLNEYAPKTLSEPGNERPSFPPSIPKSAGQSRSSSRPSQPPPMGSSRLSVGNGSGITLDENDVPRGTEHLLIVDDEIPLLRMLSRFFENLGYQVTTFSESVLAFEAFQKTSDIYDLVIVDQRMPEMSGARLATEMLKIRPDLPIIVLSGYSETLSPADAAKIGIRRFLSKPIPQLDLGVTIRSVLDEDSA